MDPRPLRAVIGLLLAVFAAGAVVLTAARSAPRRPAERLIRVTAAERRATFTWAVAPPPADAQAVLTAIAAANPTARALVAEVDGLVDLRIAPVGPRAAGETRRSGRRFAVTLDVDGVMRSAGQRGVDRLVLHELGHVVDWALVPDDLARRLDGEIPRGWGCPGGVGGACANREERFAEAFAKWATGDIGTDIDLGYYVPPPAPLDRWGAPLAALARTS